MTAYRARELAEKYESLSQQYHFIYKANKNPTYKQKSYYYRDVSQCLYIAAESLEEAERRSVSWE